MIVIIKNDNGKILQTIKSEKKELPFDIPPEDIDKKIMPVVEELLFAVTTAIKFYSKEFPLMFCKFKK